MDDGAADYAGLTLQTHNYQCAEVNVLVEVLAQFGLAVSTRHNKGHTLIYVQARSVEAFQQIVAPYVLPELQYKLVPRRMRTP